MGKNIKIVKFLAGVDEAGRGPLAGPVSVGVVVVPFNFDWNRIPGVGDSKKVTPKKRGEIFKIAEVMKRSGEINFHVALVSSSTIDRINIRRAVEKGILNCFKVLQLDPKKTSVKLDGLLKAPSEFLNQETIIKGDAKEKVIGLASILAKVTRDRVMVRHAKKFPQYSFDVHKGYGTELHRMAIQDCGLSILHRKTFCKKLV